MIEADQHYVEKVLKSGLIFSPCLELGVGYSGPTARALLEKWGISYVGTDVSAHANVDVVADFEGLPGDLAKSFGAEPCFGSVLALNVLEHVFEPIKVLDNIMGLLRPGGTCVLITPAVWPLHDFPRDYWRINPQFYEEYCQRRSHLIEEDFFEYVGWLKVKDSLAAGGQYKLPAPGRGRLGRLSSRLIHRVFDTYGRGMFFPSHVAVGAVIRKQQAL